MESLQTGGIKLPEFFRTGGPIGAVVGSILDIQRRLAGGVILTDTLFGIR